MVSELSVIILLPWFYLCLFINCPVLCTGVPRPSRKGNTFDEFVKIRMELLSVTTVREIGRAMTPDAPVQLQTLPPCLSCRLAPMSHSGKVPRSEAPHYTAKRWNGQVNTIIWVIPNNLRIHTNKQKRNITIDSIHSRRWLSQYRCPYIKLCLSAQYSSLVWGRKF